MDELDNIIGSIYIGGKDTGEELNRMNEELGAGNLLASDDILFLSHLYHADISNVIHSHFDEGGRILEYATVVTSLLGRIEAGEYDSSLSTEKEKIELMLNNLILRINADKQDKSLQVRACYDEAHPKYRDRITQLMQKFFDVIGSKFDTVKWNKLKKEGSTKATFVDCVAFSNNFDDIDPIKVRDHFTKSFVKKGWLSEAQLNDFLKSAFELMTPPTSLYTFKKSLKKKDIQKVFYEYYTQIAGKPHGKKDSYAGLLGDYFEGYKTSTVASNFNKSAY